MASDEPVPVGEPSYFDDPKKPFKFRHIRIRRQVYNEFAIPFGVVDNLEKRQFPRKLDIGDELYLVETE
jgi:hypothetical protein